MQHFMDHESMTDGRDGRELFPSQKFGLFEPKFCMQYYITTEPLQTSKLLIFARDH
jgi:hypothetical protein